MKKTVWSRKNTEASDIPHATALAAVDHLLQKLISSERQSADLEINALKAPFGVLRLPLTADTKKRFRIISVFEGY